MDRGVTGVIDYEFQVHTFFRIYIYVVCIFYVCGSSHIFCVREVSWSFNAHSTLDYILFLVSKHSISE